MGSNCLPERVWIVPTVTVRSLDVQILSPINFTEVPRSRNLFVVETYSAPLLLRVPGPFLWRFHKDQSFLRQVDYESFTFFRKVFLFKVQMDTFQQALCTRARSFGKRDLPNERMMIILEHSSSSGFSGVGLRFLKGPSFLPVHPAACCYPPRCRRVPSYSSNAPSPFAGSWPPPKGAHLFPVEAYDPPTKPPWTTLFCEKFPHFPPDDTLHYKLSLCVR